MEPEAQKERHGSSCPFIVSGVLQKVGKEREVPPFPQQDRDGAALLIAFLEESARSSRFFSFLETRSVVLSSSSLEPYCRVLPDPPLVLTDLYRTVFELGIRAS